MGNDARHRPASRRHRPIRMARSILSRKRVVSGGSIRGLVSCSCLPLHMALYIIYSLRVGVCLQSHFVSHGIIYSQRVTECWNELVLATAPRIPMKYLRLARRNFLLLSMADIDS